ncbi:MAG: class I SAM-dependent methyltransferase [Actinomycetota bacterium]|nr:class I SAM-dependent methyltransferase [Actinomycetota bacterium]
MNESVSFDRMADKYDETRGGLVRGNNFATAISPHLPPGSSILEIGVGTGAIALPLVERGHTVTGVDISPAMLAHAHGRLGARIAVADAMRLPVRAESVDAVLAVWVMHLVADRSTVLAECRRILRPGGRLVVVQAAAKEEPNDVADILQALHGTRGRPADLPGGIGMTPVHESYADFFEFEETPNQTKAIIEARTWSCLWDVSDDDWNTSVQPAVDQLAALPGPDRLRHRTQSHPLLVFEQ